MSQTKITYVVGSNAKIWRRDDHLGNFYDITPNVDTDTLWMDVMAHKSNPEHVVAVGTYAGISGGFTIEAGIVVSFDGGTTWQSPGGNWNSTGQLNFRDVWIVDDSVNSPTIWVAGDNGFVYKSTDGGLTFTEQNQFGISTPGDIQFTTSLHAINSLVCVVTGYQNTGTPTDYELTGADKVYAWITIDGGTTWTKLNSGSPYVDQRFVNNVDANQEGYSHGIWISNNQDRIIVSTNYVQFLSIDFGANFIAIPPPSNRSNHHMTWYPDHDITPSVFRRVGGAPADVTITETVDLGNTCYVTRPGDGINTLYGAHFYTPDNGYYIQRNHNIYETDDGGVTGVIIETDPTTNWYAIHTAEQDNVIYRLINCAGVASDKFVTDSNMANYVGQVIQIDPSNLDPDLPATLCWQVEIYDQTVLTYDDPVPITGSFEDCDECNPRYYELTDCEGLLAPIYTTSDLSQYVENSVPINVPKIGTTELRLTPCCGGPVIQTLLIPTVSYPLIPNWLSDLNNIANVIKYQNKCYTTSIVNHPFATEQPPGYIELPQDGEVLILSSPDCETAKEEDPDCICFQEEPPIGPGIVIEIEGCLKACWVVTEIEPDPSLELTEVTVTEEYVDCENCLKEEEEPEVRELKPRTIDPGYETGLCDFEIVEKAKCTYADLMYDKMMSDRFKIEICCKKDEEKVFLEFEKIRLKLLEDANPTPDPCDPKCSRYEFTVDPEDTAVITYIDCLEVSQQIDVDAQTIPNLIYFCGLDTTPPTAVVTHPDSSVDTYILEPVSKDCVPPAQETRECVGYEVRMSNFNAFTDVYFEYEDCNGVIQTITKTPGQKNIALYKFCALEGQVFNPIGQDQYDVFEQQVVGDCESINGCSSYTVILKYELEGDQTINYTDCNNQVQTITYSPNKLEQTFNFCGIPGQTFSCPTCDYFAFQENGDC